MSHHVLSRRLVGCLFVGTLCAGLGLLPVAMAQEAERGNELVEDVEEDGGEAAGEDTLERRLELAQELLRLTNAREGARLAMEQSLRVARQQPGIPPEFFAEFERLIDYDLMMQEVARVYANHLTVEEMEAAVKFFSSPLGRSFAEKQPAIMTESSAVGERLGQQWGMQAAERIQQGQ